MSSAYTCPYTQTHMSLYPDPHVLIPRPTCAQKWVPHRDTYIHTTSSLECFHTRGLKQLNSEVQELMCS